MHKIRAKFRCHAVIPYGHQTDGQEDVRLAPVYDGSEENKAFFAATPAGMIQATVPAGLFEVNAEYYVDFTKADG